MKHLRSTVASITAGALALPSLVLAQSNPFTRAQELANQTGSSAGIGTTTPLPLVIGRIINVALGFLGIIFLLLLLYAGFLYMTAQGEKEPIEKANKIIKQSVIGLIIIVAGFGISNFILGSLVNVTA